MKYEFTSEEKKIGQGVVFHRVIAMRDFGDVKAGDIGGWVEDYQNLSQGDDCSWVYDDACVCGKAYVSGNARISGNARVFGNAYVSGNAQISENAWVFDHARVFGNACITGSTNVCGYTRISDDARFDCARVSRPTPAE